MLTCQNLTLGYNNTPILNQLGFSLFPGSLLVLRGPNGAGKTSLLRSISGIIPPLKGVIRWNDKNINDIYQNYSKEICYIGVKPVIKEELTVIDNLIFWANLYQYPELILAAINYFKLNDYCDIKVSKLSSGLKKRVSLARLMCANRKIWLLDEADSFLDKAGRDLLYNLIDIRIAQKGIVILSSHILVDIPQTIVLNVNDFAA